MPGHEYTKSNAAFAMGLEPSNAALQQRHQEVNDLRAKVHIYVHSLLPGCLLGHVTGLMHLSQRTSSILSFDYRQQKPFSMIVRHLSMV